MNYSTLKTEIQTDPVPLGYGVWATAIDDARIAGLLNDATKRTINRSLIPSWEVIGCFDHAEFAVLTQVKLLQLQVLLSGGMLNILDPSVRQIATDIFPAGGPTLIAVNALQTQAVSRASELGLGTVQVGEVTTARVNY